MRKKRIAIILASALMLCGCGGKNDSQFSIDNEIVELSNEDREEIESVREEIESSANENQENDGSDVSSEPEYLTVGDYLASFPVASEVANDDILGTKIQIGDIVFDYFEACNLQPLYEYWDDHQFMEGFYSYFSVNEDGITVQDIVDIFDSSEVDWIIKSTKDGKDQEYNPDMLVNGDMYLSVYQGSKRVFYFYTLSLDGTMSFKDCTIYSYPQQAGSTYPPKMGLANFDNDCVVYSGGFRGDGSNVPNFSEFKALLNDYIDSTEFNEETGYYLTFSNSTLWLYDELVINEKTVGSTITITLACHCRDSHNDGTMDLLTAYFDSNTGECIKYERFYQPRFRHLEFSDNYGY